MSKAIKIACKGADTIAHTQLTPFQGNLKDLSKENYAKLKAEILKHGFAEPISVWKNDGHNYVLNGHQRLRAISTMVKDEGFTCPAIPINWVEAKDEKAAKHLVLALTSQYGEMTDQGLYQFMSEADIEFKAIVESFRFPEVDFEKFEAEYFAPPPLEGADEIPEIDESKVWVKLGDKFHLGEHRLLCNDSKMITSGQPAVDSLDEYLILTDPPYGMNVVKLDGNIGGKRTFRTAWAHSKKFGENCGVYKPVGGDDKPFDPTFLLSIGKDRIIFGANHFASKLPDNPHWLVWHKGMPYGNDFSGAELAYTSIDKKTVKVYEWVWAGMTREGNRQEELSKRIHPTQKPVGLFKQILEDYPYEQIFDPFGGSGTTLIACEQLKRKCLMVEIDPYYVQIIIERWEKLTGKKAKKA